MALPRRWIDSPPNLRRKPSDAPGRWTLMRMTDRGLPGQTTTRKVYHKATWVISSRIPKRLSVGSLLNSAWKRASLPRHTDWCQSESVGKSRLKRRVKERLKPNGIISQMGGSIPSSPGTNSFWAKTSDAWEVCPLFEAYLLDGNAVPKGLPSPFRPFSQWVRFIYSIVSHTCGVEMSNDVRVLFAPPPSFTFAEQVQKARHRRGKFKMFLSFSESGFTEEAWLNYVE